MELIHFNEDGCLSYLLYCPQEKEAIVIDPTFPEKKFLQALEKNKLNLKYILDTHTHADHASAGVKLAERTGVPYAIHQKAQAALDIPPSIPETIKRIIESNKSLVKTKYVEDNTELQVGKIKCRLFQTSGHTTDSVSVKAGHFLFTGDFLLINQCGRTDLPGGSAEDLYGSIFNTLYKLPEDTVIYPAHDYKGNINTSLGYEMINNPFLQKRSLADFKEFVNSFFPPLDAEGGKLQCSITEEQENNIYAPQEKKTSPVMQEFCFHLESFLKSSPSDFNAINSDELQQLIANNSDLTMIDVREPKELEKDGYIEGVINIPLKKLPENLDNIPESKDTFIVTLCRSGSRSSYAALYLRGLGYRKVKNLEGGMIDWAKKELPISR